MFIMLSEYLLCARNYPKHVIYSNSFNSGKKPRGVGINVISIVQVRKLKHMKHQIL